MESKNSNISTYLSLVLVATIWGCQPGLIKWLRAEWTSETIVIFRYIIVAGILLTLAYRQDRDNFLPKDWLNWLLLIGMGATGILLNNVLQFNGIPFTTVTHTTLISAMTPAITAVLSCIFIRERLGAIAILGILLSFSGVLTIVSRGDLQIITSLSFNFGDVLCFLSQVAWAVYCLLSLRVLKTMSVVCASGWAGFFGCLWTLGYALYSGAFHPSLLSPVPLICFLYTTMLGGLLALIVWNTGVKKVGPSNASIFLNIMPVAGMVSGVFLFGDIIEAIEIGGAAAIFAGVYLVSHFK